RALDPAASVVLVEAEAVPYYLRPGLIDVLAGAKGLREITPYPREWFAERGIDYRLGEAAIALDLPRKEVVLSSGKRLPFDRLLLATGAEPMRPSVPGAALPGVFTLRTAADAERIRTWAEGRRAVVVGGGWLGLEAAYALRGLLERVVVVERGPWPLSRHLDREAGQILAGILSEKGVEVLTQTEVVAIRGGTAVSEVLLKGGQILPADLVLFCLGIRPRTALAQDAGIGVDRGVVVNDFLATSVPGVYAAGDAAEWRTQIFGTVLAAREQAEVAAQNLVEPGSARYSGTKSVQRLKVAGTELWVVGEPRALVGTYREERLAEAGRYIKLVLTEDRRLVGALILGDSELRESVERIFLSGETVPIGFLSS
ncbi:MAG: FAD-dependent oxidoreductase, partial [Candidatus Bipolaricaulaceae bacterium]